MEGRGRELGVVIISAVGVGFEDIVDSGLFAYVEILKRDARKAGSIAELRVKKDMGLRLRSQVWLKLRVEEDSEDGSVCCTRGCQETISACGMIL